MVFLGLLTFGRKLCPRIGAEFSDSRKPANVFHRQAQHFRLLRAWTFVRRGKLLAEVL